jgi:molybdopterin-binding protein
VAIALEPPRNSSVRNVIRAEVAAIQLEEGFFAVVLLAGRPDSTWRARITRKSAVELGLRPCMSVVASSRA